MLLPNRLIFKLDSDLSTPNYQLLIGCGAVLSSKVAAGVPDAAVIALLDFILYKLPATAGFMLC